jgi:hypothetical protein
MHAGHYRDLIVRAVQTENEEMLEAIAAHLADCEHAKEILRAKGYGTTGMSVDAMARLVCEARHSVVAG